jgi:tRNA(Ile)-lysidine synthase
LRGTHPERALERWLTERVGAAPGEVLVAATSGGPDSVALAALLALAAEGAGASLVLAHVNHGTRPGAWQDEAVVLAVGATLGARVLSASLEPGPAGEARLRAGRYACLTRIARSAGGRRVFTAHNAEDQSETVLLALFRGAGRTGLAGMPGRRTLERGIQLERPLLDVSRVVLREYCARRHLPVALDPSNAAPGYRRNAVRAALSDLRETFPGLDEAVARCAAILQAEQAGSERASLRATLREAIVASTGDARDVSFLRLEAAVRGIERRRTGRHLVRPGLEIEIRKTPPNSPEVSS